jgi:hypothetical protein
MFPKGEQSQCPLCGVDLAPVSKLPAREADAEDEDDFEGEKNRIPLAPQDEVLPWTYLGRGRGALLALCVLGLLAFAQPWVHMFAPDKITLTGIDIARRTGLTWAAGVGWFTLLPVVLSRRTIRKMRGARLAAAILGAIPAVSALSLLAVPPGAAQVRGLTVQLRFEWGWGIFATVALGVLAALVASLVFGGRMDDIAVSRGSSAGETLH